MREAGPAARKRHWFGPLGTVCAALLALTAGACDLAGIAATVQIDGSSTVHPITEAVAEEFHFVEGSIAVPVGISGTGGGFSRFCNGETDITNASRPIKTGAGSEAQNCEARGIRFIELPVAYDGLSVVVHPSNDWATCLTLDELHQIWAPESERQVVRWNQVNPDWPDLALELFGAGTDSGTFDYFTEVVNGATGAIRTDFTPSEDDNVLVQGIAGSPNAMGFFGHSFVEENQDIVRAVEIDGGEGCVEATSETIQSGEYQPFSRPLFIYVSADAAERPEVQKFVEFYLQNAGFLAADVGYVAFPDAFYEVIRERWETRTTGSIFSRAEGTVGQILGVD